MQISRELRPFIANLAARLPEIERPELRYNATRSVAEVFKRGEWGMALDASTPAWAEGSKITAVGRETADET